MFKKNIHYSQDLEMAILGIYMLEKTSFARTYGLIDEQCFYFDSHRAVFSVIKSMYDGGIPIDILTVIDRLVRVKGRVDFSGTSVDYFITNLTHAVVSGAHLEYHCHIVKSMWMEREIINITHGGMSLSGSARQQIADMQLRLAELNTKSVSSDWKDLSQLMIELYHHQDAMKKSGGMGITSGIKKLDSTNGGFHPGELIIIGARPSVGKSALAGQMAIEMAKKGVKVGIISLEMNNVQVAARIAAIQSGISYNAIYRNLLDDQRQSAFLYEKIGQTVQLPIHVTDTTNVNMNEIRAKAEILKHRFGLDCLMLDYLQLVEEEKGNRSRENEIAKISRGCKIMAKEMDIPVMALCQLNREAEKRKGGDRYPHLSDLRESGALEQDADVVMFLHRDWMNGMTVNDDGGSTEHDADLVIRKWRNGMANWIVPLQFDGPRMKFTEKQDSNWKPININPDLFTEPVKSE